MAAEPLDLPVWSGIPLTKLRAPRVRRDALARPALLERLAQSIAVNPVTLVCAPGGSGKSTLLAQLAAAGASRELTLLWISIDADDNDPNRLFAALLRAVEPLELVWEADPQALAASVAGSGKQTRAALAALVNALCTSPAHRIVFVLDDLHRLDRPDVFELIESLVERLPEHVALVLGTRVEPHLPLARWRMNGELGELSPGDLAFTEAEAVELARMRLGASLDERAIRTALARTYGWAAGLSMLLQPRTGGPSDAAAVARAARDPTHRHLFAYLAQEILSELSPDLQQFLLRCSILDELTPPLCEALIEGADARDMLDALYRRNLFVTALDEDGRVLRFHDLFRDFLQSELGRRHPEELQSLHERAARAEPVAARAIHHWLAAERWDEAVARIRDVGEELLAEGALHSVERWIDRLPAQVREADPEVRYLRGACAWFRWDWPRAKSELEPAVAGLTRADQCERRVRAMFHLVDALNSSGESARARELLDEIERLPLGDVSQAQLALQRAWCALPAGAPEEVARHMREFAAVAQRDPARVCPATADRIHALCIGLPGVAESFERFFALAESVRGRGAAPWQLAALAMGGWARLWRGQREEVVAILHRIDQLLHQFGGVRLVAERGLLFKVNALAAMGEQTAATALSRAIMQALQAPESAGHRAAWTRTYLHGVARMWWMFDDAAQFLALEPTLTAPRQAHEWPFLEGASEMVRGQAALLREDWRAAEQALARAAEARHLRQRLPMIYGDPRVSLAYVHLMRKDRARAIQTFDGVLRELLAERAIGPLLLEPRRIVRALLEALPAERREASGMPELLERWRAWTAPAETQAPTASPPRESTREGARSQVAAAPGPLAVLTEREREVLERVAGGAGNKHIARELSLSLHTVKRHIANILDKLDCASRGQAADLFRRTAG